ncbi:transcriptional activator domain-containing protein [Micromonospora avicenniae]|uniref:Transcriptional activator domain-containing protein n=2 Tax=Micromonospora avicenniae TaxID=1198245 RepID=A0A1N7ERI5_9ACTN|nr:transcriptional activator domain-containing protein [Micromonospora avicenniae]
MSLLFVLALLAGPPVVLLSLFGPPVRGWPTAEQMRVWVVQPLTEQSLTIALTIAAWLVWLVLAYTVTIRVLTRLRATVAWLRHLPLPTPLQATASGMAGAAVLGVSANAVTTPPPQPPLPVTAGSFDASEDTTAQVADATSRSDDGIAVAGGWLPREVAEQISAAAALVWLRRRRAYRPHPPGQQGREDPDLVPLPATVAAVRNALADHPSPPTGAADTSAGSPQGQPAALGALPPAGAGFTGPGALAAGRGLLVTTLLAGQRHPGVSLVITRTVLASLLGSAPDALTQRLPGLAVVDGIDEASRFFTLPSAGRGHGGQNHVKRHAEQTTHIVRPAPALIVDEAAATGNPEALADVAITAGTVVVLGRWPAGQTWQVDLAGHTSDRGATGRAGPRLCVLDQVTATDLLTVIAHADQTPPDPVAADPMPRSALEPVPCLRRQPHRHEPGARPGGGSRRLELRVLGEPALLVDGQPLTVRRSAAMQVLVLLAAHPDGANTQHLTDAIWPGLPRRSLTGRLYTTLSDLRAAVRTACGLSIIDHTDDRYRLTPGLVDVDLWRFHHAVRQAATAVTDAPTAWQGVIDAYPGDLAAGRNWSWLDPIRESTRRQVLDAHAALADAAPDAQHALAWLQAGLRVDPYNADLHTRAVNTLIALGDHATADELREAYARRLADAGIGPSDAVLATATSVGHATVPTR